MASKISPGAPQFVASGPQDQTTAHGVKVAAGYCRMWTRDGRTDLLCLLGTRAPQPTRGYGGYQASQREGRTGRTSYAGVDTPAVDVLLLLEESVAASTTVEDKIGLVERLAGKPTAIGGQADPGPAFLWAANHWTDSRYRTDNGLWVVESVDWGTQVYDDDAGLLRVEDVTLSIAWYDPASLPDLARATGFQQKTMAKGETLRGFARRVLGDAKRWKDIATLNRTNPRCPTSPEYAVRSTLKLSVPPRDR